MRFIQSRVCAYGDNSTGGGTQDDGGRARDTCRATRPTALHAAPANRTRAITIVHGITVHAEYCKTRRGGGDECRRHDNIASYVDEYSRCRTGDGTRREDRVDSCEQPLRLTLRRTGPRGDREVSRRACIDAATRVFF